MSVAAVIIGAIGTLLTFVLSAILVPSMLGYVNRSKQTSANAAAATIVRTVSLSLVDAENAGFGIQLCDFVECDGRSSFGSEVTLDAATGKPAFKIVLWNTVVWTVVVVVVSTVVGFILALLLNNEFRGRKIARAIVVFPWATTLVIQASVWNFIINTDYGTLNTLLKKLGIISTNINWTPTPGAYFAWECFVGIFVTIPFVTFCVLSGLQGIDESFYEAATADGANYWQKLFHITIPLVRPQLTVSTVLNIIYVFNSFPIIWTMSKGDPANRTDTLVTYLYKLAFYNGKQGQAAAISVIGFLILLVCASVYMVFTLRGQKER